MEFIQALKIRKDQEMKEMKNKIDELNSRNYIFEVELKKEINSKTQVIEALQRENEQLHFAIEEDNSNHEVLAKEKDTMIERLQAHLKITTIQLESIRKDYEDGTLMWEKSKIEMRENLELKENQIAKLTQFINELNKRLDLKIYESEETMIVAEKTKDDLKRQIHDIIKERNENDLTRKNEIIGYVKEVGDLESCLRHAEHEISDLKEQLDSEKSARDDLESEKAKLLKENEGVNEDLLSEQTLRKAVQEEHAAVLNEKTMLTQEVMTANSLRRMLEDEKQSLLADKERLQQMLNLEIEYKNKLNEENENLTQKLFDEKSLKLALEKEIDILLLEKEELIKEAESLNVMLKAAQTFTMNEIKQILEIMDSEKTMQQEFDNEKESLLKQNKSLKKNIEELTSIQEVLVHDKEILTVEKEDLAKHLSKRKTSHDELEIEKSAISVSLNATNDKLKSELYNKQEELNSIYAELKALKTDYKSMFLFIVP